MSHWLHPEAEAELEEAALYLAEHASPALARAFLLEYERVVGLLEENQQRGPHIDHGLRMYGFFSRDSRVFNRLRGGQE